MANNAKALQKRLLLKQKLIGKSDKLLSDLKLFISQKKSKQAIDLLTTAPKTVDVIVENQSKKIQVKTFALFLACTTANIEIIAWLIKSSVGKEPIDAYCDYHNQYLIFEAIKTNNPEIVKQMLQIPECLAKINKSNSRGNTPLIEAISLGGSGTEIANLILEVKPNIHLKGLDDNTALHFAVDKGNRIIVDKLLKAKADVNAVNIHGIAPLYLACRVRDLSLVEILCKAGANPNAVTLRKSTALISAIIEGCTDIVEYLVNVTGVKLDMENPKYTPLHIAVLFNRPAIIKILLSKFEPGKLKEKIHEITEKGYSALSYAATNGSQECLLLLLKAGGDPNKQDGMKLTLLDEIFHNLNYYVFTANRWTNTILTHKSNKQTIDPDITALVANIEHKIKILVEKIGILIAHGLQVQENDLIGAFSSKLPIIFEQLISVYRQQNNITKINATIIFIFKFFINIRNKENLDYLLQKTNSCREILLKEYTNILNELKTSYRLEALTFLLQYTLNIDTLHDKLVITDETTQAKLQNLAHCFCSIIAKSANRYQDNVALISVEDFGGQLGIFNEELVSLSDNCELHQDKPYIKLSSDNIKDIIEKLITKNAKILHLELDSLKRVCLLSIKSFVESKGMAIEIPENILHSQKENKKDIEELSLSEISDNTSTEIQDDDNIETEEQSEEFFEFSEAEKTAIISKIRNEIHEDVRGAIVLHNYSGEKLAERADMIHFLLDKLRACHDKFEEQVVSNHELDSNQILKQKIINQEIISFYNNINHKSYEIKDNINKLMAQFKAQRQHMKTVIESKIIKGNLEQAQILTASFSSNSVFTSIVEIAQEEWTKLGDLIDELKKGNFDFEQRSNQKVVPNNINDNKADQKQNQPATLQKSTFPQLKNSKKSKSRQKIAETNKLMPHVEVDSKFNQPKVYFEERKEKLDKKEVVVQLSTNGNLNQNISNQALLLFSNIANNSSLTSKSNHSSTTTTAENEFVCVNPVDIFAKWSRNTISSPSQIIKNPKPSPKFIKELLELDEVMKEIDAFDNTANRYESDISLILAARDALLGLSARAMDLIKAINPTVATTFRNVLFHGMDDLLHFSCKDIIKQRKICTDVKAMVKKLLPYLCAIRDQTSSEATYKELLDNPLFNKILNYRIPKQKELMLGSIRGQYDAHKSAQRSYNKTGHSPLIIKHARGFAEGRMGVIAAIIMDDERSFFKSEYAKHRNEYILARKKGKIYRHAEINPLSATIGGDTSYSLSLNSGLEENNGTAGTLASSWKR